LIPEKLKMKFIYNNKIFKRAHLANRIPLPLMNFDEFSDCFEAVLQVLVHSK